MKRVLLFIALSIFLLSLMIAHGLAASEKPEAKDVVPGKILVKVKAGGTIDGVLRKHGDASAAKEKVFDSTDKALGRWYEVVVPGGTELKKVDEYGADSDVEYAEPAYKRYPKYTPNDAGFVNQWGLATVNAPAAWNTTKGSSSVTIAVIDSGIDADHEDLKAKLVAGASFLTKKIGTSTNDGFGHGTHVAGIAAAITNNNGVGIAGMACEVKLMPIQIFSSTGSFTTTGTDANAIRYAADKGARVINMSYGGTYRSQAEQDAITYAHGKGAVLIAAAGNEAQEGNPVEYPAACSGVIAVGATTKGNTRAAYSNYGSYIDVVAPGGAMHYVHDQNGIYSTMPNHRFNLQSYGYSRNYDYLQGTSMAAPFVSGLAALLISKDPSLTSDKVEELIESTALDLGVSGKDVEYGCGLIQADRAFMALFGPATTTTVASTTTTTEPSTTTTTLAPTTTTEPTTTTTTEQATTTTETTVIPSEPSTTSTTVLDTITTTTITP